MVGRRQQSLRHLLRVSNFGGLAEASSEPLRKRRRVMRSFCHSASRESRARPSGKDTSGWYPSVEAVGAGRCFSGRGRGWVAESLTADARATQSPGPFPEHEWQKKCLLLCLALQNVAQCAG
jgi:hypothetical protein